MDKLTFNVNQFTSNNADELRNVENTLRDNLFNASAHTKLPKSATIKVGRYNYSLSLKDGNLKVSRNFSFRGLFDWSGNISSRISDRLGGLREKVANQQSQSLVLNKFNKYLNQQFHNTLKHASDMVSANSGIGTRDYLVMAEDEKFAEGVADLGNKLTDTSHGRKVSEFITLNERKFPEKIASAQNFFAIIADGESKGFETNDADLGAYMAEQKLTGLPGVPLKDFLLKKVRHGMLPALRRIVIENQDPQRFRFDSKDPRHLMCSFIDRKQVIETAVQMLKNQLEGKRTMSDEDLLNAALGKLEKKLRDEGNERVIDFDNLGSPNDAGKPRINLNDIKDMFTDLLHHTLGDVAKNYVKRKANKLMVDYCQNRKIPLVLARNVTDKKLGMMLIKSKDNFNYNDFKLRVESHDNWDRHGHGVVTGQEMDVGEVRSQEQSIWDETQKYNPELAQGEQLTAKQKENQMVGQMISVTRTDDITSNMNHIREIK